jgi:N-acetylglucosamine malate deacetylase 1
MAARLLIVKGKNMVNFIRNANVFGVYELIQPFMKYSLPIEDKLPARNILVFAPHPDDESIGCGGAIAKHTRTGGKAAVVFCTGDGAVRDKEAAEALKILGVAETVSFGYGVETLKSQDSLPEKLDAVIREKKPEIVFVPFFIDNHDDHRALNKGLAKACAKGSNNFMVYAYPVWFPLYPNVLIDIGDVWETKKQAIECYKSQTATRDYVKMAKSLGEYWAEVKGRGLKVAETFFRASAKEYCSLVRKSLGK